ncbi:MAG: hypothetical protein K2N01_12775 [Lachnospiraceae bacterium]|nr:hypothetical protein [Lachnospiraceae bacterium]
MKTFQLDGKPKILEFTNYERKEETVLFREIFSVLENEKNIEIGKKQIGPCEDFYQCKIDNAPFTLFFDVDYGTCIRAEDQKVIEKLKMLFENN